MIRKTRKVKSVGFKPIELTTKNMQVKDFVRCSEGQQTFDSLDFYFSDQLGVVTCLANGMITA